MKKLSSAPAPSRNSLVGLAVTAALLAANAQSASATTVVRGVVAGSYFTAPTATAVGSSSTSYYSGAKVCFDLNGNGVCDQNEPNATTNSAGAFALSSLTAAALVAEIPTTATNGGHPVTQRVVLRAPQELIAENTVNPALPVNVAVTPLSTEVVRAMAVNSSTYSVEKSVLAGRLNVPVAGVLGDPNKVTDSIQKAAIAKEGTLLTNRFGFAAKMLDRGDAATITDAQQAAMNVEGIPRYDHIFIVMLENKATLSIKNTNFAPKIQSYLAANNQFSNYFATGNPSEPNYTALGGADDWGITDDSQWNCDATGANTPMDLPLPTNTQPGLANSPFAATCTQAVGVNHNISNQPNLFTAIAGAGMNWRTYSESMNPGQDVRTDSIADSSIAAPDHVYAPGTTNGNAATIGDPNLQLTLPAGLYKTKHHPGMAYQTARSSPDFKSSNRTLGGGQWDSVLLNSAKYSIPAGYNLDQFGADLQSGDIGNLNFVVPDQCDDMHGIGVSGKDSTTGATVTASDCGSVPNNYPASSPTSAGTIITRGDNYVDYLVKKIEASPIWQNQNKRVAIVLMFDEGNATGALNSCCGWVPGAAGSVHAGVNPLKQNPDGTFSPDTTVNNYSEGNHGHGNSIFAVINNQPTAPKGIADSDAYSHFAFVRTLQDMFQLADPKVDGSYMGRSKYTESFIAANILNLPEYAGSADTHFDSVRPMNHSYVIPTTYTQKQSADVQTAPQVGPDGNQINVWSLK